MELQAEEAYDKPDKLCFSGILPSYLVKHTLSCNELLCKCFCCNPCVFYKEIKPTYLPYSPTENDFTQTRWKQYQFRLAVEGNTRSNSGDRNVALDDDVHNVPRYAFDISLVTIIPQCTIIIVILVVIMWTARETRLSMQDRNAYNTLLQVFHDCHKPM